MLNKNRLYIFYFLLWIFSHLELSQFPLIVNGQRILDENQNIGRHHHHHPHHHHHNHNNKVKFQGAECRIDSDCEGRKGVECSPHGECICSSCSSPEEERRSPSEQGNPPICGSNGQFYPSVCELEQSNCLFATDIHPVLDHLCFEQKYHIYKSNGGQNIGEAEFPGFNYNPLESHMETTKSPKIHHKEILLECNEDEFELFKRALWESGEVDWDPHNRREINGSSWSSVLLADGPEADKDHLIQLIFSAIDDNQDFLLNYHELAVVGNLQLSSWKSSSPSPCQFPHFLQFQDSNVDGLIHVNEFFQSFAPFYGVTMISLEKSLEHLTLRGELGRSVIINCDILGSPPTPIVWHYHGDGKKIVDIDSGDQQKTKDQEDPAPMFILINSSMEFQQEMNGSLRIERVVWTHGGNYSCQSVRNQDVLQIHSLIVYIPSSVQINPKAIVEYKKTSPVISSNEEMTNFHCSLHFPPAVLNLLPLDLGEFLKSIHWSWSYNNQEIVPSPENQYEISTSSDNLNSNFSLHNSNPLAQSGSISCQVSSFNLNWMQNSSSISPFHSLKAEDSATLVFLQESSSQWTNLG